MRWGDCDGDVVKGIWSLVKMEHDLLHDRGVSKLSVIVMCLVAVLLVMDVALRRCI